MMPSIALLPWAQACELRQKRDHERLYHISRLLTYQSTTVTLQQLILRLNCRKNSLAEAAEPEIKTEVKTLPFNIHLEKNLNKTNRLE